MASGSTPESKACSRCGTVKPLTDFYRDKGSKDGRRADCATCVKVRAAVHRMQPEVRERNREYLARYYRTEHGREIRAKHDTSEKARQRREAYRQRPDVQERVREYTRSDAGKAANKKHYEKNHDHYLEQHRAYRQTEQWKEQQRRYWATERGKAERARQNQKRRAARIAAKMDPNSLTLAQWEQTKAHFGHRCAYCQKAADRLTRDHVVPLSQGGTYTMGNIIPACPSCNSRKNTKTAPEWMAANGMDWPTLETKIAELLALHVTSETATSFSTPSA